MRTLDASGTASSAGAYPTYTLTPPVGPGFFAREEAYSEVFLLIYHAIGWEVTHDLSGWTRLSDPWAPADTLHFGIYWKRVFTNAAGPLVTFTLTDTNLPAGCTGFFSAKCTRITGVDQTNPLTVLGSTHWAGAIWGGFKDTGTSGGWGDGGTAYTSSTWGSAVRPELPVATIPATLGDSTYRKEMVVNLGTWFNMGTYAPFDTTIFTVADGWEAAGLFSGDGRAKWRNVPQAGRVTPAVGIFNNSNNTYPDACYVVRFLVNPARNSTLVSSWHSPAVIEQTTTPANGMTGTGSWTNTDNAKVVDGSVASYSQSLNWGGDTPWLVARGFNFENDIPEDCEILGIEFSIKRRGNPSAAPALATVKCDEAFAFLRNGHIIDGDYANGVLRAKRQVPSFQQASSVQTGVLDTSIISPSVGTPIEIPNDLGTTAAVRAAGEAKWVTLDGTFTPGPASTNYIHCTTTDFTGRTMLCKIWLNGAGMTDGSQYWTTRKFKSDNWMSIMVDSGSTDRGGYVDVSGFVGPNSTIPREDNARCRLWVVGYNGGTWPNYACRGIFMASTFTGVHQMRPVHMGVNATSGAPDYGHGAFMNHQPEHTKGSAASNTFASSFAGADLYVVRGLCIVNTGGSITVDSPAVMHYTSTIRNENGNDYICYLASARRSSIKVNFNGTSPGWYGTIAGLVGTTEVGLDPLPITYPAGALTEVTVGGNGYLWGASEITRDEIRHPNWGLAYAARIFANDTTTSGTMAFEVDSIRARVYYIQKRGGLVTILPGYAQPMSATFNGTGDVLAWEGHQQAVTPVLSVAAKNQRAIAGGITPVGNNAGGYGTIFQHGVDGTNSYMFGVDHNAGSPRFVGHGSSTTAPRLPGSATPANSCVYGAYFDFGMLWTPDVGLSSRPTVVLSRDGNPFMTQQSMTSLGSGTGALAFPTAASPIYLGNGMGGTGAGAAGGFNGRIHWCAMWMGASLTLTDFQMAREVGPWAVFPNQLRFVYYGGRQWYPHMGAPTAFVAAVNREHREYARKWQPWPQLIISRKYIPLELDPQGRTRDFSFFNNGAY